MLEEGKPCPVCGSTHHPAKAQKAEDAPSKEQLEKQKGIAEQKRNAAIDQSNICAGLQSSVQSEEIRLKGLGYSAEKTDLVTLPEQIQELRKQLEYVTQNVERKKAIPELLRNNEAKRTSGLEYEKALRETKTKAIADRDNATAQIEALRAKCTFKNIAEAKVEINRLRKEATAKQAAIDTAQKALNTINQTIEGVKATIKTLEETLKTIVDINKAEEETKRDAAQNEINTHIAPFVTAIEGRTSQNRFAKERLADKEKEMKGIEERFQWLKTLNDTMSGQLSGKERIMLETYILSAYFERIIRKANLRLLKMTNNQYELRRKKEASNNAQQSGLDLDVIDHHSGTIRTVKGLSGGESFMASLSLALGLSDEIQSSAGCIHLDTMFVDEGFGSLDEDSRIQARNTLQKLSQEGNRLIGVISHVPELKTIEKQIQVHKNIKGVSTAEVVIL
jgi:exonuclease SbcC